MFNVSFTESGTGVLPWTGGAGCCYDSGLVDNLSRQMGVSCPTTRVNRPDPARDKPAGGSPQQRAAGSVDLARQSATNARVPCVYRDLQVLQ